MVLAAGDYFPGAKIRLAKAATTVAIAKGKLLSWDATNDGFVLAPAATTTLGPYAVCVEAMATGGTQVKVCYGGLVCVTGDGVLEPDDILQPSTSTAGKVMVWSALTSNAANAHIQWRRPCGTFISDDEALGDGTLPVDSADNDVIIINLREGI